jgi:hypothetical protein
MNMSKGDHDLQGSARACLQHFKSSGDIVGGRSHVFELAVEVRQLIRGIPACAALARCHIKDSRDLRHHPGLQ